MATEYDVVVIGGGPGGYVAAIRAGQYGLKTALIERDALGGTCLNRGCIPTKAMLHTGEVLHEIQRADRLGIKIAEPEVDLDKLYNFKDKMVKKLVSGVKSLLKGSDVDVFKAVGSFVDKNTLRLQDENGEATQQLKAKHIIIATGSRPAVPPIPGLDAVDYWTSTTLLEENRSLPDSMIIIGGGVIGTECATILNDLGVKVTILEMMDQLLPQMDNEAAELLRKSLKKDGVEIHTGVKVTSVSAEGGEKQCRIETKSDTRTVAAAELMLAVGRGPVTEIPGIENLPIKTGRKGIEVNRNLQTAVPSIYAIGDVNGNWQLAHAASAEGLAAVDHIAGKRNHTNSNIVPSCIYTRPEIASVGMTAVQAKESGYPIAEGYFPIASNSKSMIMGETSGFVKVISDEKTGELLGAQIVAPRATDMIGEMTVALSAEVTVEEIGAAIHPHPTVSEALMEALHDIEGLAIHKASKQGAKKSVKKSVKK